MKQKLSKRLICFVLSAVLLVCAVLPVTAKSAVVTDCGGDCEDGERSGDDDVLVHGFLLPFGSLGVNPKDGELF